MSRVQLTVVDHPLARARLSRMRDERTDNAAFRAALRERKIIVEAIATGGAVRTYNVLLAEERAVAAALLAVDHVR